MRSQRQHFSEVYEATESGGEVAVDLPTVAPGETWEVERLVLSWDSATAGVASIYLGPTEENRQLQDAADIEIAGNLVGEYNPPIRVPGGEALRVVFTTASAGTRANVRVQRTVVTPSLRVTDGGRGVARPVRSRAGG